jgi:NAD-dependent SIR2 family protein deacetylase
MLKAVDFYCDSCGETIEDYIMRNEEDIPSCKICDTKMTRLYTRIVYKQKHKERPYPTHNLGAGERASFGNKP